MYIYDTNIYVSLFLEDSLYEYAAFRLLEKEDTVYLPHMILWEVVTVLMHKKSRKLADRFTEFVHRDPRFVIINTDVSSMLEFRKDNPQAYTYFDMVLLYHALTSWRYLVTYDKKLMNMYKRRITI